MNRRITEIEEDTMFAEKLDAALAQNDNTPARPFPNLRARETVKTIVTNIVETVNLVRMSEGSQAAFALGYIRGAVDVLRGECEEQDVQFSALPHLLDMLDTLNRGGLRALRTLAENVAGQGLREGAEDSIAKAYRASRLVPTGTASGPTGLASDECTCAACRFDRNRVTAPVERFPNGYPG